ncbi:MAG: hypothetical protein IKN85_16435 [Oscillospiraceae bacterium]|nr:hypothetical protein [Oscillospiraceae bacterium]MBR6835321.1 hypothetical protein [Oscillospiraceae bacterium]
MMKFFKNLIASAVALVIAVTTSSMNFIVSANQNTSSNITKELKQKICIEEYEDLLLSLYAEEHKTVEFPDEYGGIYYDGTCGAVTICLTDLENSKKYSKYFKKTEVNIKKVKNSLNELNDTYQYISDHMIENNVTVVSVSEKYNDIRVSVHSNNDKSLLMNFLDSNGYNSELVTFEENQMPLELAPSSDTSDEKNSTINNRANSDVNYAYAGSKIMANYYLGGSYDATIGANAYNPSTNQYGILTAGHLVTNNGITSYSNSSSVIFNNNSSFTYFFGGVCDVAFIPFNSNNTFVTTPSLKNGSITTCIYDTQPIVSPYMNGIEIVKYGLTTGRKTGDITSLSTSVTYAGNITISDVIQYDIDNAGGDSGAPIGIEYSNINDGLHFMGIHSGGNGTTGYATKLTNIENYLGVVIIKAI